MALSRVRLWLGPDHLLHVSASAVGERYKRFYFADIQSFTVHRTARWTVVAIVWVVLTALALLPVFTIETPEARWVFAGIAAVFLVLLIMHLAFGPTCAVMVRTAVQLERLHSLGRVRTARRVLERLRPLIEAAQSPGEPVAR